MDKIVFLHNTYKNKKNNKIYYTLDRVIDKTEYNGFVEKNRMFILYKEDCRMSILYADFPANGSRAYVKEETQFLKEFTICN